MVDAATSDPAALQAVGERLAEIALRIGQTVAGPASFEVDRDARFPHEAIDALRAEGVLSAIVPVELGGMGASIAAISMMIRILSRYCAATGCILGMHTIELSSILRFADTPAMKRLVAEQVERQLLVGNANSEAGIGGDVMRSNAALVPEEDGWRFDKQALAASYCEHADIVLSTSRRSPEAADTDQRLAIIHTDRFSLEPTSGWDTLGLRGTCSTGLHISGHLTEDDFFPVPFADIANAGGGQLRHVLLTPVWVGLAEAALEDAHTAVRAVARKSIGTTPLAAVRLAEMSADVQAAQAALDEACRRVDTALATGTLQDIGIIMWLRSVKVITTMTAVHTATRALQLCGINGYRRGPEFRLERIIRDAHGGMIMVSNDRYLDENAQMLAVRKVI